MKPSKELERARKPGSASVTEDPHGVLVAAWMKTAGDGLPPARLVDLTERAFAAIWSRAQLPLGDVALAAIADRVLCSAGDEFPLLAPITVGVTALRFEALRKRSADLDRDALTEGLQRIVAEFLSVIGRLTAEVLTSALHARLSAVTLGEQAERRTNPRKVTPKRRNSGPAGTSRTR